MIQCLRGIILLKGNLSQNRNRIGCLRELLLKAQETPNLSMQFEVKGSNQMYPTMASKQVNQSLIPLRIPYQESILTIELIGDSSLLRGVKGTMMFLQVGYSPEEPLAQLEHTRVTHLV